MEGQDLPEVDNLSELSVTQLKKRMKERGIDASGCSEKTELVERLRKPEGFQRPAAASSTAAVSSAAPAAEAEVNPLAQLGQMGRQMAMLPILWGSNKINWDNPMSLLTLQITFGAVLLLGICLLQLTLLKIAAAKDTSRVLKPGDSQHFTKSADGTVSTEEYDTAKTKETRGQLVMGGAICTFLHYQFTYIQPLLMTSIMNLFHIYDCKAVLIHLFGFKVKRPWAAGAAANPLQQWAEKKKEEASAEAAKKES